MKKIKTRHDGWDCVPELMRAAECIDETARDVYEIQNCVRSCELDDLVLSIRDRLQEAIEWLDDIDMEQEFVTVDED
jgi:hypothetical protein